MKLHEIITAELPNCPQDELALLGSIVYHAYTIGDPFPLLAGRVDESDFLDIGYAKLFKAFQGMIDAGIPIHDPLVARSFCVEAKVPESVCQPSFLSDLLRDTPNAAHLLYYADEVRDTAQKRRLIAAATRLLEAGYDRPTDWRQAAGSAEVELARIAGNVKAETRTIGEVAAGVVAKLREELNKPLRSACMTGIQPLDEVLGPLMRKELIVVAARPGIGKTAFGMQVAMHAADKGRRVFFASLEMGDDELATRVICRIADINSKRVRSGDVTGGMIDSLGSAADQIADNPVMVWSPPGGTLAQIRGLAKHCHSKAPLSLVVVDYLQIIEASGSERGMQRHEQIGVFSAGLRKLAKELDVPVIALAQFNRAADNQEPTLANLRESGSIEQDANIVIGLHSGETSTDIGDPFTVTAIILKHRAGAKGRVRMTFHPVETRFGECITADSEPPKRYGGRRTAPSPNRNAALDQYSQGRF